MFRVIASLAVAAVVGLAWLLFGDHGQEDEQSQEQSQSAPQPSSDDDALRRSLGGK